MMFSIFSYTNSVIVIANGIFSFYGFRYLAKRYFEKEYVMLLAIYFLLMVFSLCYNFVYQAEILDHYLKELGQR
jgi:hypothetical protein